ncbi:hypothetical protein GCM10007977_088070 [Dactylosporangium sucinum]|uniref:Uncharacterized protein n=1 Tax=Dactylosporangium sucinum TaxID=1424081 RepID=A0A917UAS0_9ACTN|nr:hypothetical protein GCM10007977_088070 [Dactylosporangium sucinum]
MKGVQAVANDIEVRLPIDAQRPDPDIAAAVRALQWTFVPADQVGVRAAGRRARVLALTGVRGVTPRPARRWREPAPAPDSAC